MMSALKLSICAALALALAACGDAKLDTKDAKSFADSIQRIYDSTKGKEREDFRKFFFVAMNGRSDLVTMSVLSDEDIGRLGSFYNVLASRKRPEELAALDGLTAEELVELGRGLMVTYIEGRLQEIQREMDLLKGPSDFYRDYMEQLARVEVSPANVATPAAGPSGKTAGVTVALNVRNGSDLDVVDLQRSATGGPWEMEISLGESRVSVTLSADSFKGPDGSPPFPVPAGQSLVLSIAADVSGMEWPYPPEMELSAAFPEGIEPCLEGWDKVFEAEDSFRRVTELDRQRALLTRQLSETRA
jgi:hypothetical protein